jgi:low affinity Fe/Cu permease
VGRSRKVSGPLGGKRHPEMGALLNFIQTQARWYTTAMSNINEKIVPHHPHVKIVRHIIPEEVEPVAPKQSKDSFHRISMLVSSKLGSPIAFLLAVLLIVLWIITGPFFNFSDTWQLVINTTTTIVTFLMVFAIQNTQNRDARAMQLKLNELIKGSRGARTEFVDIEDLTDTELDIMQAQFKEIHDKLLEKKSKLQ